MTAPLPAPQRPTGRVLDVALTAAGEAQGDLLLVGCFEGEAPDPARSTRAPMPRSISWYTARSEPSSPQQ